LRPLLHRSPTISRSPLWRVLGVVALLALFVPRVLSGADHDHAFSEPSAESCAACLLSATPGDVASPVLEAPVALWSVVSGSVSAPVVPVLVRPVAWIDACGPPALSPSQSA